jgi:hypothetical protein
VRILVAPMAVPLRAMGPYTQCAELCRSALARGHEVIACAAEDEAWRDIPGVANLGAPLPRLLGWIPAPVVESIIKPLFLSGRRAARWTGMESFEQVQASLGLSAPSYFFRDMARVGEAIREARPDVAVMGRYSGILAARAAGLPQAIFMERPQSSKFASSPRATRRLRRLLRKRGFGDFRSILDIAGLADLVLVPNLRIFSDLGVERTAYVGPLRAVERAVGIAATAGERIRDTVVAYVGVSGVDTDALAGMLDRHYRGSSMRVVLVRPGPAGRRGIVESVPRFEKSEMLPRVVIMIHHGGRTPAWIASRREYPN